MVNLHRSIPSLDNPRLAVKFPTTPQDHPTNVNVSSTLALLHESVDDEKFIVVYVQWQYQDVVVLATKLWEGKREGEGIYAFQQLRNTLEPMLQESLQLNEDLLNEAVVPYPMTPVELVFHLVDVIASRPNMYLQWHLLLRALFRFCQHSPGHTRFRGVLNEMSGNETNREELHVDELHTRFFSDADMRSRLLTHSSEYFSAIGSPVDDGAIFEDDGNSPLIVAISKGYTLSCLYLLLAGANPNEAHPVTGDFPLHVAIEHEHFDIVKLLLTFDANPLALNNNKAKPVDKAPLSSLELYESLFKEITVLKDISKPPLIPESVSSVPSNSLSLLSLDGGGVKSLNTIQLLIAIEQRMVEIDPQCDSNILHYFDYIAGSSGGSFIPLVCLYGNISLHNYFASMLSSFILKFSTTAENGKSLESLLKTGVGENTVMSDLKYPRIIITTTIADFIPSTLHLMTNYGQARNGQKGPSERKVWEAGRMSSAAPVYFEPFQEKFLDGSIMANNPTLTAMSEIISEEGTQCNLKLVLSLGTGVPPPIPLEKIHIVPPTLSFSSLLKISGSISSAKNILNLGFNQLLESDGHEVSKAQSFSQLFGAKYYRLSPPLSEFVNIMETNLTTIITMLYDSYLFRLRKVTEIDAIARLLLQIHKNKHHN